MRVTTSTSSRYSLPATALNGTGAAATGVTALKQLIGAGRASCVQLWTARRISIRYDYNPTERFRCR